MKRRDFMAISVLKGEQFREMAGLLRCRERSF